MRVRLILLLIFCLNRKSSFSQSPDFPKVNAPFPDFNFTSSIEKGGLNVNLATFNGKWLILDFWNEHCPVCINSFPSTDSLQRKFASQLNIVLVGFTGSINGNPPFDPSIRQLYQKIDSKYHFQFANFFDSVFFQRYDITACPLIFVIDPNGILKGITPEINAEEINDFIRGKTPHLVRHLMYDPDSSRIFKPNLPFLVYNNGGEDSSFLFRSLLAKWSPDLPERIPIGIVNPKKLELLGCSVDMLYSFAYFGKGKFHNSDFKINLSNHVFHKVKDPSIFTTDYSTGQNLFCYSLCFPSAGFSREDIMKAMQRDLQTYFGFKVKIEERRVAYYSLLVSKRNRYQPHDHPIYKGWEKIDGDGLKGHDIPIRQLLDVLYAYEPIQYYLVDKTSLKGNIDIELDCFLNRFEEVKDALEAKGFELKKVYKKMKIINLSD